MLDGAAIILVFAGLLGGLLKVQLEEVAAFKRKREERRVVCRQRPG